MTNNELFINATRANYQFPFRGMINIKDLNKGISNISYNCLNLPSTVTGVQTCALPISERVMKIKF